MTNIYEPQGISYVDAHATFLSNELLPLVEKTVTDRKVPSYNNKPSDYCAAFYCTVESQLGSQLCMYYSLFRHISPSHQPWSSRGSVQVVMEHLLMEILLSAMM